MQRNLHKNMHLKAYLMKRLQFTIPKVKAEEDLKVINGLFTSELNETFTSITFNKMNTYYQKNDGHLNWVNSSDSG